MPNIEISAMTPTPSAVGTDIFPIVRSGANYKLALNAIFPASSTNNAIAIYDGTGGVKLKNSLALIDTSGNITGATWNATVISPTYGGTGVNNGSNLISIAGNFTINGAFSTTFAISGNTSLTLPTSGTLVNSSVTALTSLSQIGTIISGSWEASLIGQSYGGTGFASYSPGQVLIGNALGGLTKNTISGTGGVAVTNGDGSILIGLTGTDTVASLAGTSNQISVSAPTGAVTISLTNGISLGSYQGTTPPTGGILCPGAVAIGTSSPSPDNKLTVSTAGPHSIVATGSLTARDGSQNQSIFKFDGSIAPTASTTFSVMFDTYQAQFTPAFGQVISNGACFRASPFLTFNIGQVTNLYGFWYDGGTGTGSGTIINSYGGYFAKPLNGSTTSIAVYAENASIGSAYVGINPPANGMVIQGNVIMSGTTNTFSTNLFVNGTIGAFTAFRSGDGSASAPAHAFNTSTNSGMWLTTANSLGFSTNGTNRFTLNTTTFDGTLPFRLTSSNTYITINGSSNTVRGTNAGSDISQSIQLFDFAGTGTGRLGVSFNSGGVHVGLNFNALNSSSNNIIMSQIIGGATSTTAGAEVGDMTFLVKPSSGVAATVFQITPNLLATASTATIRSGAGSAGTPGYAFVSQTNTGMAQIYSSQIDFVIAGSHRMSVLNTAFVPYGGNLIDLGSSGLYWKDTYSERFYAGTGTVSLPAYTFNGDTNTGIYRPAVDTVSVATNGTLRHNIDATGCVTIPTTSAFLGYLTTTAANVTGDATLYRIVSYTEIFDQNSNFNPTTGVFTAPVTGRYQLSQMIRFNEVPAAATYVVTYIATSNRSYASLFGPNNINASTSSALNINASILVDMDAGDTAALDVIVAGTTKTVDVDGGSGYTYFSGYLAC